MYTQYMFRPEFYRTWVSSKNQHINIRAETKPISCTKCILSCKNREILNATNAPHALPTSLFTRETLLSGFHLENHFWFLENFDLKNSQTLCGVK